MEQTDTIICLRCGTQWDETTLARAVSCPFCGAALDRSLYQEEKKGCSCQT